MHMGGMNVKVLGDNVMNERLDEKFILVCWLKVLMMPSKIIVLNY